MTLIGPRLRARLRKKNNVGCATCSQSTYALHQKTQQSLRYKRPDTALSWPGDIKLCSHIGNSDAGKIYIASDDHTLLVQLCKNALITAGIYISELTLWLPTFLTNPDAAWVVPGSVQYCNGTTHVSFIITR